MLSDTIHALDYSTSYDSSNLAVPEGLAGWLIESSHRPLPAFYSVWLLQFKATLVCAAANAPELSLRSTQVNFDLS